MDPQDFWSRRQDVEGEVRTKMFDLPEVIHHFLAPHGGLHGRRVLEVGCGEGLMAAGMALGYGAQVRGIEISEGFRACETILRDRLGLDGLPPTLAFEQVSEGDLGSARDFDVAASWSVFEHVRRGLLNATIADLRDRLRPGGLVFLQIAPLYFSPDGAHLWALGHGAWEHLTRQASEIEAEIAAADLPDRRRRSLSNMLSRLNRVTAPELRRRFEDAGFEVLTDQRERVSETPPAELLDAYDREALITRQVILVMRRG